jgi:hypothetical protein
VNFDYIGAVGRLMQAIDILGHDPNGRCATLKSGNSLMGGVWPGDHNRFQHGNGELCQQNRIITGQPNYAWPIGEP